MELPKLVCSESLNTDSTHSVGGCVYVDGHSLRLPHSDSKLYAVKSPTSDMTHSTCTTSGTVSHTQLSQSCSSENSKKSSSQNSLVVNAAPSCRRNLVADFEKHLTFRPKLNDYSLKIVSKTARNSVPVVHRLLEGRKALQISPYEQNLTFQPKLNTLSVKLAQERTTRIPEVRNTCTHTHTYNYTVCIVHVHVHALAYNTSTYMHMYIIGLLVHNVHVHHRVAYTQCICTSTVLQIQVMVFTCKLTTCDHLSPAARSRHGCLR